jgi:mono/diheme cytochrome c family protein
MISEHNLSGREVDLSPLRRYGRFEPTRRTWRKDLQTSLVWTFIWPILILSSLNVALAQKFKQLRSDTSTVGNESLVTRGRYIVEDVAVCSQCHTPRDTMEHLDRSKWLEGAALWLQPAEPIENWPIQAPRIAGNPPGTDAEMIKLLTTGVWRNDKQLRPPMPQFRMSTEDAQAVVAYLKSLTPKQ